MEATSPRARGIWARRGLASRARIDRTVQAMLLRQLYLAHFEQRQFRAALEAAEQAAELEVLPDVVQQDLARALVAVGELERAALHLRVAGRIGPPSRRAFHWWTLGCILYVAGRYDDAAGALERAARWGTRDKPLYQAHLALAQRALGRPTTDLGELYDRLEAVPAGRGYGRFVLGLLAEHRGQVELARRHLEAFVERSTEGRVAMCIALEGEVAFARRVLGRLSR
jgi:tetratricopeptide (TPR) repeat protein